MEKGIEKGIEKGMEKGRKEGSEIKSTEVVMNLLNTQKFSDPEIAVLAGVSEDFVLKIKNEMGEKHDL